MPHPSREPKKRCLIVERHAWETGFEQEQLQVPLEPAAQFFGLGADRRRIRVRLPGAGRQDFPCSVSPEYRQSHTRRVDGLALIGLLGPCFVFMQQTNEADVYDFWCQYDAAIIVARFRGARWWQGRTAVRGAGGRRVRRGRLATIVEAPVDRPILHADVVERSASA